MIRSTEIFRWAWQILNSNEALRQHRRARARLRAPAFARLQRGKRSRIRRSRWRNRFSPLAERRMNRSVAWPKAGAPARKCVCFHLQMEIKGNWQFRLAEKRRDLMLRQIYGARSESTARLSRSRSTITGRISELKTASPVRLAI